MVKWALGGCWGDQESGEERTAECNSPQEHNLGWVCCLTRHVKLIKRWVFAIVCPAAPYICKSIRGGGKAIDGNDR